MSIEVRHLSFSYGSRQVLRDVSFSVGKGRLLSVLGPNGVGKSTLFRCILGLLHGFQGEITVDGTAVSTLGARELARRSRGTPRLANRLLKRVRDFAQVKYQGRITGEVACLALDLLEVDKNGLDQVGFVDILYGSAVLSYSRCQGVQTYGTPGKFFYNGP